MICADTFVQWFSYCIKVSVSHKSSAPCYSFIRSENSFSEVNVILICFQTVVLVASNTSCFQLSTFFFLLSKTDCLYFLALNYLSRFWRIYLPCTNTALPDRSFIAKPVKTQLFRMSKCNINSPYMVIIDTSVWVWLPSCYT